MNHRTLEVKLWGCQYGTIVLSRFPEKDPTNNGGKKGNVELNSSLSKRTQTAWV